MKTFRFLLIFTLVSAALPVVSQNSILPDIKIYTLEGSAISAGSVGIDDRMMVLVFWNPDDGKSLQQLRMLNDEYGSSIQDEKVKVVGICTNYSGTLQSIRPLVSGIGIGFEIYIDRNNDLKRAMNIPDILYTMIVDPEMDIHRYTGYCNNLLEMIVNQDNTGLANISAKK